MESDAESPKSSEIYVDLSDSDEEDVFTVCSRKRKALPIVSSDESEDEEDDGDDNLDLSNSDPQPSHSRDINPDLDLPENFHSRRYGKLSNNLRELERREELIDWLKEVEKNPSAGRAAYDQRREELELAGNWRQQDREHGEIYFDIRIPGSPVKGYWVLKSDGKRNVLSSYYAAQMRLSVSQTRSDANESYRDPANPLHDVIKDSMRKSVEARPPMDIIYTASLILPANMGVDLWETMQSVEPVQDYVGIYNGDLGRFSTL
ncbi:uncharacterized protein LOC118438926 [Folsomia candida]|uniref:uncharacterized protein LOC118438926 n=1 Tax=Folsomia candida TaxID=158441 RepID=UPI0016053B63|nr:uncharacterized protein LOC118438926 [Folsomia candida]